MPSGSDTIWYQMKQTRNDDNSSQEQSCILEHFSQPFFKITMDENEIAVLPHLVTSTLSQFCAIKMAIVRAFYTWCHCSLWLSMSRSESCNMNVFCRDAYQLSHKQSHFILCEFLLDFREAFEKYLCRQMNNSLQRMIFYYKVSNCPGNICSECGDSFCDVVNCAFFAFGNLLVETQNSTFLEISWTIQNRNANNEVIITVLAYYFLRI